MRPGRQQVHPFVERPLIYSVPPACDPLCGLQVVSMIVVLMSMGRVGWDPCGRKYENTGLSDSFMDVSTVGTASLTQLVCRQYVERDALYKVVTLNTCFVVCIWLVCVTVGVQVFDCTVYQYSREASDETLLHCLYGDLFFVRCVFMSRNDELGSCIVGRIQGVTASLSNNLYTVTAPMLPVTLRAFSLARPLLECKDSWPSEALLFGSSHSNPRAPIAQYTAY